MKKVKKVKKVKNIMINFEQPDIRPISKNKYQLQSPWKYIWQKDEILRALIVPQGFISDGASSPRLLWTLTGIRPDGLIRGAALAHDFLYKFGGDLPENCYQQLALYGWINDDSVWTRKNADRLFARICREAGVSKFNRRLCYRAVRMFGWLHWQN